MNKIIIDIEPLPICEEEALLMYLNENGIEYSEVQMKPSEDSGDFLSDSWFNKSDEKYEERRDDENIS